nr:immunoglobulin heavy chain junction region [Macaca mulatta]
CGRYQPTSATVEGIPLDYW